MSLGQRIARLRQERDLTLQEAASGSGLTPSFLSRLERDRVNISVANLRKLARFFNVPMTYFFEGEDAGPAAQIVRAAARPRLSQPHTDAQIYELAPPNSKLDAQLVEARSGAIQQSDGEQMVYVLSGRVCYTVGTESYTLEAGDTLFVQRAAPQRWECIGAEGAAVLFVRADGGRE
jgi:transcriptional regulator with XRE-family HTH domain